MEARTLLLRNGVELPRVGLGTFKAGGPELHAAVAAALDVGIRHIDTASIYKNQAIVGEAIASSGVPRSEVWRGGVAVFGMAAAEECAFPPSSTSLQIFMPVHSQWQPTDAAHPPRPLSPTNALPSSEVPPRPLSPTNALPSSEVRPCPLSPTNALPSHQRFVLAPSHPRTPSPLIRGSSLPPLTHERPPLSSEVRPCPLSPTNALPSHRRAHTG